MKIKGAAPPSTMHDTDLHPGTIFAYKTNFNEPEGGWDTPLLCIRTSKERTYLNNGAHYDSLLGSGMSVHIYGNAVLHSGSPTS